MIQQIDHVNIVVQDLTVMTDFYCQVLGMKQIKRVALKGQWIDDVAGLKKVEANVVYLSPPSGPRLELIEFAHPGGTRPDGLTQTNTMGIRHLAFRVDDIEATAASLRAHGVTPLSKITTVPDTEIIYADGQRKRLVYFLDPEQNLLELCEYRADT